MRVERGTIVNPAPQPIHAMSAAELRLACASLRHEITQIGHWRRLVRARLDLTVARAVLPGRLGDTITDQGATAPAVSHSVLVGIAQPPGAGLSVTDLPRLRSVEDSLAIYETEVRRALMVATDALVDRMTEDPAFRALHQLAAAEHRETLTGAAQCTVGQRA